MENSWRPRPNEGNNICPTCYISHFPFCPLHPHPYPSSFPGPTFDPIRPPSHLGRPVFSNHPDPFHDPGHWPNLPPQLGAYNSNNYNNNNTNTNNFNHNVSDDRSSKRLRVDGMGSMPYGGENDVNLSKTMGYDHGRVNSGLGFDGSVRRYPVENPGFDRSFEGGREVVNSMMSNNVETGYRPEYRSGYNMNKSSYGVGGGNFGGEYDHDRQLYGYRPTNYGSNFEHMQSNGAAMHYDKRSGMVIPDQYASTHPPLPTDMMQPGHMGYGYHSPPRHFGGVRQPIDSRPYRVEGYQCLGNQNVPTQPPFGPPPMSKQSEYGNSVSEHVGHFQPPQRFEVQPPLPSSPPPPLPMEPPAHWSIEHKPSASPKKESPSLFPAHIRSSAAGHYPHAPTPDSHGHANPHLDNFKTGHASRRTFQGDSQGMLTTFGQYPGGSQPLPPKHNRSEKPCTVDAAHLFKQPHRTSRPDHFVIILRGLPGSGKSYYAKMLRDLELEHGGSAPRIHSMDDYFMTEVEKIEENETSKPLARGKKPVTKTVIEYCYEPEMEEAYRSSMLKAFKKTLEEGVYTFVIVDDRNLRVADFAQFWATSKRSGYEAYVLEAPYKDPAGCTARNVHGFTQDEVEKMAAKWEDAPSLYLQLDVKSLLHGDDLKDGNIEEVDMDTEDEDFDASESQAEKTSLAGNLRPDVSPKDEKNSDAELGNHTEAVKHLGRSKWSDNLDDDGDEKTELLKGKANVLSGLLGTYGKEGKSVHWSDQGGRLGFSIGAVNKAKKASLVIGPGAGYNWKSNPLPEEEMSGKSGEEKKHSAFKARLQAEQDSFRAVFDRRRQRIGGVLTEDE